MCITSQNLALTVVEFYRTNWFHHSCVHALWLKIILTRNFVVKVNNCLKFNIYKRQEENKMIEMECKDMGRKWPFPRFKALYFLRLAVFFYTLNNFSFSVCSKSRFRFLRFLIFLYLSAAVVGQVEKCSARRKQIA